MPRCPSEGDVAQRAVQRPHGVEPALQDYRGRHQTDGAEVHVRAAQVEVGEGEPAVPPGADARLLATV